MVTLFCENIEALKSQQSIDFKYNTLLNESCFFFNEQQHYILHHIPFRCSNVTVPDTQKSWGKQKKTR